MIWSELGVRSLIQAIWDRGVRSVWIVRIDRAVQLVTILELNILTWGSLISMGRQHCVRVPRNLFNLRSVWFDQFTTISVCHIRFLLPIWLRKSRWLCITQQFFTWLSLASVLLILYNGTFNLTILINIIKILHSFRSILICLLILIEIEIGLSYFAVTYIIIPRLRRLIIIIIKRWGLLLLVCVFRIEPNLKSIQVVFHV